jgi:aryl-alcohol dehydrogenase
MINADVEARHDVTVAVVREKGGRFKIETASIDPPRPDDVIVRVVATVEVETDIWRTAAERPPVSAMLSYRRRASRVSISRKSRRVQSRIA